MEDYGKINIDTCCHCWAVIEYTEADTHWDDNGSNGSVKLVKCPRCGKWHEIAYEFADWYRDAIERK